MNVLVHYTIITSSFSSFHSSQLVKLAFNLSLTRCNGKRKKKKKNIKQYSVICEKKIKAKKKRVSSTRPGHFIGKVK